MKYFARATIISIILSVPAMAGANDKTTGVKQTQDSVATAAKAGTNVNMIIGGGNQYASDWYAAGEKEYHAEMARIRAEREASGLDAEEGPQPWQYYSRLEAARSRGRQQFEEDSAKKIQEERNAANQQSDEKYKQDSNLRNGGQTVLSSGLELSDVGNNTFTDKAKVKEVFVQKGQANFKQSGRGFSKKYTGAFVSEKGKLVKRKSRKSQTELEVAKRANTGN